MLVTLEEAIIVRGGDLWEHCCVLILIIFHNSMTYLLTGDCHLFAEMHRPDPPQRIEEIPFLVEVLQGT